MNRALTIFRKVLALYSKFGLRATIREIGRKIGGPLINKIVGQNDVFKEFEFTNFLPIPAKPNSASKNTVNWFIPVIGQGSGGHGNMFRLIRALEDLGIESRIIIVGPNHPKNSEVAAEQIKKWFFPLKAKVFLYGEAIPEAFLGMATEWKTAYYLRSSDKESDRGYFIQDFEPWFYPRGSHYALAEETYRFGFKAVTAGAWLSDLVSKDYGMKSMHIGFSPDWTIYGKREVQKSRDVRKVFFYARPPTPRRDFELGMLALERVTRLRPEVEVVFAGWDLSSYKIPFKHQSLGILKEEALPDVYAQVDAALVISATNMSLLPVDLMACEVPVVSNRTPGVAWLLNDSNCYLCDLTVESMAASIIEALDNPEETRKRVAQGVKDISTVTWAGEAVKAAAFLGLTSNLTNSGNN
jgi:glycosyltransferase involved in cell wall biosynthesis